MNKEKVNRYFSLVVVVGCASQDAPVIPLAICGRFLEMRVAIRSASALGTRAWCGATERRLRVQMPKTKAAKK